MPRRFRLLAILFICCLARADHTGDDATAGRGAPQFQLKACDFLKRAEDQPNFPENWALRATGADLVRRSLGAMGIDYDQSQLAIVDTGLRVAGNPDAGAALAEASPEQDHGDHGTHVAGIAASEKYGVNPQLKLKVFPVQAGRSGFDGVELLNQIRRAGEKDNGVQVINLSLSSFEDPAVLKAVEIAVANGKWIVWGGGNGSAVNSQASAGLAKALKNPEVFSVGATSPYRAPSEFSNFGPTVQYYAPGSDIPSLNSGYNANLAEPKTKLTLGGTSQAAPHFAAVLATLRGIEPRLTVKKAREILDFTSVRYGKKPPIPQVNALGAISLAYYAKQLGAPPSQWDLPKLRATISQGVEKAIQGLEEPTSEKCGEWEAYLQRMRSAYFLAPNNPAIAKKLAKAYQRLPPQYIERVLFGDPSREKENVEDFPAKSTDKDHRAAQEFHKGERNGELTDAELDALARSNPTRLLERMPATPANLKRFLNACRTQLHLGVKSVGCQNYLLNAPLDFTRSVARQMAADPQWESMTIATLLRRKGDTEEDRRLALQMTKTAARNWKKSHNLETLDSIFPLFAELDLTTRQRLVANFRAGISGGKIQYDGFDKKRRLSQPELLRNLRKFQSYLPLPKDTSALREIAQALTHEKKNSLTGMLDLISRQLEVGQGSPEALVQVLDRMLDLTAKGDEEVTSTLREFFRPRFNSRALLRALEADPKVAEPLAKLLLKPGRLDAFHEIASSEVILGILDSVDKETAGALLDNSLVAWVSEMGMEEEGVLATLRKYADRLPQAKKRLAEITGGPQTNPKLQRVRLAYLREQTRRATEFTPEVAAYFKEHEGGFADRFPDVPPQIMASSPKLRQRFQSLIRENGPTPETLRYAATVSDPQVRAHLLDPQLPRLASALGDLAHDGYDLERFAKALVTNDGASPTRIAQAFAAVESVLQQKDDLPKIIGGDERFGRTLGHSVLNFAFQLDRSKAGRKYYADHPEFAKAVADVFRQPNVKAGFATIPSALHPPLRENLPSADDYFALERTPHWIGSLLLQDPATTDYSLSLIDSAPDSKHQYTVLYRLASMAAKHPGVRRKVRAHLTGNTLAAFNSVLLEFGVTE